MVVSLNRGPQYRPQNTIILIIGTPKKVPLILGNRHIGIILPCSLLRTNELIHSIRTWSIGCFGNPA